MIGSLLLTVCVPCLNLSLKWLFPNFLYLSLTSLSHSWSVRSTSHSTKTILGQLKCTLRVSLLLYEKTLWPLSKTPPTNDSFQLTVHPSIMELSHSGSVWTTSDTAGKRYFSRVPLLYKYEDCTLYFLNEVIILINWNSYDKNNKNFWQKLS